jgi:hypothetical protein
MEQKFPQTDPAALIDAAREQLSQQLAFGDAIDTKLGVFLGVQSALIALLMAAVVVQVRVPQFWGVRGIVVSAGVYLVSVAIGMCGLWPRKWKGSNLNIRRLYADYFDLPGNAAGWNLARSYARAYQANEPAYKLKALMIRLAPIGLIAQTILLAGTLFAGHVARRGVNPAA